MKLQCPFCKALRVSRDGSRTVHRLGRFYRKSDGQWISRFWCVACGKSFSSATLNHNRWQKKRHLNERVRRLLCAGVSQREAARVLKINPKTVVRKFRLVSKRAHAELRAWNERFAPCVEVEFDDLETFEHTKCKPLSVTLMVEYKTRRILGFQVSQMPAKGHLAAISLRKYGYRQDHRPLARKKLFAEVKPLVAKHAHIRSDSNPHYPPDVRRFFPQARHETVLGGRSAITGQGELKKLKHDPIFSLNHTCAMLRAHINRLFRKTWCTTKRPAELANHIALYALTHNRRLAHRLRGQFQKNSNVNPRTTIECVDERSPSVSSL